MGKKKSKKAATPQLPAGDTANITGQSGNSAPEQVPTKAIETLSIQENPQLSKPNEPIQPPVGSRTLQSSAQVQQQQVGQNLVKSVWGRPQQPTNAPIQEQQSTSRQQEQTRAQHRITSSVLSHDRHYGYAERPPPRPKPSGSPHGRVIQLAVNHFPLKVSNPTFYHYDVDIKPVPKKPLAKYNIRYTCIILLY